MRTDIIGIFIHSCFAHYCSRHTFYTASVCRSLEENVGSGNRGSGCTAVVQSVKVMVPVVVWQGGFEYQSHNKQSPIQPSHITSS